MSHQSFVEFYEGFLTGADGEAVKARLEAITDRAEFTAAVVAAGQAAGFDFDESDVGDVMRASEMKLARAVAQANGELEDEALEAVAGGASFAFTSIPTVNIRMFGGLINPKELSSRTIMCPW